MYELNLYGQDLIKLPEGLPKTLHGNFTCSDNKLTSLEGCPESVYGLFDCSNNKLLSLEGSPRFTNIFDCSDNQLTTLEGCPELIFGDFICSRNPITSLKYLPKDIYGLFECHCDIKEYGLGLLLVKHLHAIDYNATYRRFRKASVILNKYIENKTGFTCTSKEVLQCKIELEKAGLGAYAKL